MSKAAQVGHEAGCEIRFGQVGLAQVRIRTTALDTIRDEIHDRIKTAPQLFERTAVCLDLSALEHEPSVEEVRGVFDVIRDAGLFPIGLAHGTAVVHTLADALRLPVLTQFRAQTRTPPAAPAEQRRPAPSAAAEVDFSVPTLMHHHPVRSGQRVYAKHRDLVITSVVGAGSEVIADGCVHIYGPLRGRAIAGARGEVTARVFCQEFQAELVSIAGVFRVFETIPSDLAGKPVQAWLDGDDLRLARIGA